MENNSKKAFTLIELLVVISIILIASSIIFVGGNGGAGAKLSSSQRIVSGIAQGARGQAILKNVPTRLIIHNDPAEPEKFRRFIGIVYQDSADDTKWIAATQGTYLPEGIYFDAASSKASTNGNWAGPTLSIEYPRAKPKRADPAGTGFYYYEFNSNGTVSNLNSYLVLRAGIAIFTENEITELRVDPADLNLRSGLILRRAGTTTPITEPLAIKISADGSISLN